MVLKLKEYTMASLGYKSSGNPLISLNQTRPPPFSSLKCRLPPPSHPKNPLSSLCLLLRPLPLNPATATAADFSLPNRHTTTPIFVFSSLTVDLYSSSPFFIDLPPSSHLPLFFLPSAPAIPAAQGGSVDVDAVYLPSSLFLTKTCSCFLFFAFSILIVFLRSSSCSGEPAADGWWKKVSSPFVLFFKLSFLQTSFSHLPFPI